MTPVDPGLTGDLETVEQVGHQNLPSISKEDPFRESNDGQISGTKTRSSQRRDKQIRRLERAVNKKEATCHQPSINDANYTKKVRIDNISQSEVAPANTSKTESPTTVAKSPTTAQR